MAILTSNIESACPGNVVIFNCDQGAASQLEWELISPDQAQRQSTTFPSSVSVPTTRNLMFSGGIMGLFIATLTSQNPLQSTLTVTATRELNGTEVQCAEFPGTPSVEVIMLLLTGKFNSFLNHM